MESDIMRLTYSRGDAVKYVSHLDFVKVFERAVRRAALEPAFSKGFNPRMIMVFGNPLPVGYTSCFELVDINFARPYEPDTVTEKLNEKLPGDVEITSAKCLQKPYTPILSSFKFAEYEGKISGLSERDAKLLNDAFYNHEKLFAMKRSKSGEKLTDVKPLIKSFEARPGSCLITTATGQEGSLRPELALKATAEAAGLSCEFEAIRKLGMYP